MNRIRQLELSWQEDHLNARVMLLAVMYGALGLLYAMVMVIPSPRPIPLPFIAIGLILGGMAVAIRGRSSPTWVMHGALGAFSLTVGLIAANSVLPVGVVAVGPGAIVAAMYIGAFCTTIAKPIQLSITVGAYVLGAALSSAEYPDIPVISTVTAAVAVTATLSRLIRQLHLRCATDALTKALHRTTWTQIALRQLRDTRTAPITVAILDLDNFKAINDEQGHLAGDRLLREVAQSWMANLRDGELLGRFGGDEFILLIPGATAAQTRDRLEELHQQHPAAWTAGVAQAYNGGSLQALLGAADADLLAAKRAGTERPPRSAAGVADRRVIRSLPTDRAADPDWRGHAERSA